MAVGLAKQGKTLFYRDLHYHLKHSTDRFVVAPGIKGMVMLVFTLPSFPYVFKVIRDRFAAQGDRPADGDRQVPDGELHDRVGRMADTLEYSLVACRWTVSIPICSRNCSASAPPRSVDGDSWSSAMSTSSAHAAAQHSRRGAGATATRRGCAMRCASTATRSRSSPAPASFPATCCSRTSASRGTTASCSTTTTRSSRSPKSPSAHPAGGELRRRIAAEPYWRVGDDVFPEQFERFLVANPRAREIFYAVPPRPARPGVLGAQAERVRAGLQEDVFPYPEEIRFSRESDALLPRLEPGKCARCAAARNARRETRSAPRSPFRRPRAPSLTLSRSPCFPANSVREAPGCTCRSRIKPWRRPRAGGSPR